jgi:hypothetical protein
MRFAAAQTDDLKDIQAGAHALAKGDRKAEYPAVRRHAING